MKQTAIITITGDTDVDEVSVDIHSDPPFQLNIPARDQVGVHRVVAKIIAELQGAIIPGTMKVKSEE